MRLSKAQEEARQRGLADGQADAHRGGLTKRGDAIAATHDLPLHKSVIDAYNAGHREGFQGTR